jgi:hypothetical protein
MDIDAENTFRALKDERPIAKRQWWCNSLGIHTWTKYDRPPVTTNEGGYTVVAQYRECACCGIINRKVISRS